MVKEMLCAERPQPLSERHFYNQQQVAIERFAQQLASREAASRRHRASQRLLQRLPLSSSTSGSLA